MTWRKRAFDIGFTILLAPAALAVFMCLVVLLWWHDGRPLFYGSERMHRPGQPFTLWKFRTMRLAAKDSGVCGGDKSDRITPFGRKLRRLRMDELPQFLNILRGDISFVGPRPPLRQYVERFPELYARVLRSRPGVTGLASLVFARHEEAILRRCTSAQETDEVYARRCVPRKARIDLLYQNRAGLGLDLWIIALTVARSAGWARGRRLPRRRPTRRQPRLQPLPCDRGAQIRE